MGLKLAQLRDQPHLSVSAISTYTDCGLQFKFSRIDKLAPEFKADALIFGTAIHAVLAEFYDELKTTGQKLSVKQLQEIFGINWQHLALDREDIKYKADKDYEILLMEGKELLAIFHQKIPADEGEIIGIEQAFQFWLDGLPIPIIGAYDLVLEEIGRAHV